LGALGGGSHSFAKNTNEWGTPFGVHPKIGHNLLWLCLFGLHAFENVVIFGVTKQNFQTIIAPLEICRS
jgi:hypothetical protein